nr:MAG TPA: hypothetical protein [Caudoviricetes sp.]
MAYKQKPCRVCGKLFTPCAYCEKDDTAFHWRAIACSIECGKEYLRRVLEARQKDVSKETVASTAVENSVEEKNEEDTSLPINEENAEEKTEVHSPVKMRNRAKAKDFSKK